MLTPPFVTPYDFCMGEDSSPQKLSTRQLLNKIPSVPCLYRHSVTGVYYGSKKLGRKRKEKSFQTTDRKLAERKLKDWLGNLGKVDSEVEHTTLDQLLAKFEKTRSGMSKSTVNTETWIVATFKRGWAHGLDIRVSNIKPSMLDEWLAKLEPNLKNSSYNRVTLFLKQLFDLAVNDRIIAESPFARVQKGWKKPEKPKRRVPTDEQFQAIVASIRLQKQNIEAEQSANFVEFTGLAGVGEAEASTVEWGDVNWEREEIAIRRQKTKELFYIPIYPDLMPLLKKLHSKDAAPPPLRQRIFAMRSAKKSIAKACERLKFHPFTPRNIRAYRIRKLWRAGVDIKLIAKWQGHTDGGELVINTYTEVFGENDAEYISAELGKLTAETPQKGMVTLAADDHAKLLAELAKLRAQVSPKANEPEFASQT